MNDGIGESAGRIFQHLKTHGPTTSFQLKLCLEMTPSEVLLAVGWLCREGKTRVVPDREGYKVQLNESSP